MKSFMREKVSIIIPCWNVEKYIERTLKHVQNQTYSDFECICIDDGSSDRTGIILDQFAEKEKRIKVIHTPNRGVSAARNRGIQEAVGKKLFFFDGDDVFEADLIERVIKCAKETRCETVIYGYGNLENGKVKEFQLPFIKSTYFGEEIKKQIIPKYIGHSFYDLDEWIAGKKGIRGGKINTALWHMMCDADIIRKNGIQFDTELALGEDTIFTTEYLCYTKSVAVLNECLYYLCIRSESANTSVQFDPFKKIESKRKLIDARIRLGKRLPQEITLFPMWQGTLVLSAVQLVVELGMKKTISMGERQEKLNIFLSNPYVKEALNSYKIRQYNRKSLPIFLVKHGGEKYLMWIIGQIPEKIVGRLIR